MTLPPGINPGTHILIIRRGDNMRVMLPIHPWAMRQNRTKPPEIALEAAKAMLAIQQDNPGRADMPISPVPTPMGLVHRGSEYVLDPEAELWPQLNGHWEDMTLDVLSDEGVVQATLPVCVLNLDDILERPL